MLNFWNKPQKQTLIGLPPNLVLYCNMLGEHAFYFLLSDFKEVQNFRQIDFLFPLKKLSRDIFNNQKVQPPQNSMKLWILMR